MPGIVKEKTNEVQRLLSLLKPYSVPELCDGMGLYRAMDYQVKPRIGAGKIMGPAFTVELPSGEGALAADAILEANPGDVLVLAGKGNCNSAYWGDHRSACAMQKRLAGVVVDGAFRDVEGCREVGFPVFARALACGTAAKGGAGALNVPVTCAGVSVNPGDIVVGDENGVCVLRQEEVEGAVRRAGEKREAQQAVLRRMEETGEIIPWIKK